MCKRAEFTRGGDLQDVSEDDDGGESSQVGGLLETQVEEESSSEEPDPGERERGGEAAPFTR